MLRTPVSQVGAGVMVHSSPPPPGHGATYGVPATQLVPRLTVRSDTQVMDEQTSPAGPVIAGGVPLGYGPGAGPAANSTLRVDVRVAGVDVVVKFVQQVPSTLLPPTLPAPHVSLGDTDPVNDATPVVHFQL